VKILWLKSGPLHPLDTGGKIAPITCSAPSKAAHDITYFPSVPPDVPETIRKEAVEYCHRALGFRGARPAKARPIRPAELAANFVGSALPYVIRKYRSFALAAALHHLDAQGLHDLIAAISSRPPSTFSRRPQTQDATLLFQHNVESLIWQRLHEKADRALKRFYFAASGGAWKTLSAKLAHARCRRRRFSGRLRTHAAAFRPHQRPRRRATGVDCGVYAPPHAAPPPLARVSGLDGLDAQHRRRGILHRRDLGRRETEIFRRHPHHRRAQPDRQSENWKSASPACA